MKSSTMPILNLCLKCHRRLKTCLCQHIKPFDTNSRFIILMHPKEFKREKVGTGRFTHLILQNSAVLVGVNFDDDPRFQGFLDDPEYESFVLYPGEDTIDLSTERLALQLKSKAQFFIIDGTWASALKMMRLTTKLHPLPRVSFGQTRVSEFKVKQQPLDGCLSTVESVHQLIVDLNQMSIESTENREANLMDVFRHMVDLQIKLAGDQEYQGYRKKSFTRLEERKLTKRWARRNLFFSGLS